MTTSTMTKVSIAAASAACIAMGSTVLTSAPAQAITLSAPFQINVSSGTFAGATGNGTVSWESTALTGSGLEILQPGTGLLGLSLDFVGNTYTAASAVGFPSRPRLVFSNGSLFGLDYLFQVQGSTEFLGLDPLSNEVTTGVPGAPPVGSYAAAVPTPALLPGLLGLSLAVSALRKRKAEETTTQA
ncbi:PTPA-CTERM sorting domain-containing protein [Kovacikia minuta CCNUW1]|uniref:PTPA-CTERM sorting domain-containing protein n=1 Tax=Kovacikia minuta TaxID=2931930 RepID=UPI001CCFF7D9|nr:PTPA-CTERM sorting domain-containing protein [Kovacikia minuta]UBF27053.1 PTPA-CTERM sorting domain-containing protein [Kovacikia minuta CCNUW1]